jgi:hypothetical protein
VTKQKHTTLRLTKEGRERLERLAPDYPSHSAAIEDALAVLENGKIAFGQQVQRTTARLIDAVQSGDERAIGGAQVALAELLHSLPAAIGIVAAIRDEHEERAGRLAE